MFKSWIAPRATPRQRFPGERENSIDDVMIKDPYCDTYFPQRNGVHLSIDGKDLYFCSRECRDKYAASQSRKKT
jgi:YHS domain-containing protein